MIVDLDSTQKKKNDSKTTVKFPTFEKFFSIAVQSYDRMLYKSQIIIFTKNCIQTIVDLVLIKK